MQACRKDTSGGSSGCCSSMVQSASQILHSVGDQVTEDIWELNGEPNLELFKRAIRVGLNQMSPWLIVEEGISLPFKINQVLLCAR